MRPPLDLPLFARAAEHDGRTAIVAPEGAFTYADLLDASARVASGLLDGAADLAGARVAFLAPPGWDYVAVQWGIWRAGGIAVPLAVSHPPAELEYVVLDADAAVVVAHPELATVLRPIAERNGRRFLATPELLAGAPGPLPEVDEGRPAHDGLHQRHHRQAQGGGHHARKPARAGDLAGRGVGVDAPTTASSSSSPAPRARDRQRAHLRALGRGRLRDPARGSTRTPSWERIESGELTLFMAVPTVYRRLIAAWEDAGPERRRRMSEGCARMRLMVSGSAALPVQTLERWREISGHTLLERYGMTEMGMALSNPLRGERRPGYVGVPLPGVEVRLVDDEGAPVEPGTPGEIEVRGDNVFAGVLAAPGGHGGSVSRGLVPHRRRGRGGGRLLPHPGPEQRRHHQDGRLQGVRAGDRGDAADAPGRGGVRGGRAGGPRLGRARLRGGGAARRRVADAGRAAGWARERLAPYKLPRDLRLVDALPRNAMGKVTKADVVRLFAS